MIILGTNSIKDTGYNVANSCRFDDGSSDSLSRTPSSSGSSTNWTYSVWVKRSADLSTYQRLLSNGNQQGSGSQDTAIQFMLNEDTIRFDVYDNGVTRGNVDTKRKFRDTSAWYHFVFVWNTTSSTSTMNGSSTDRMQIWVNGVQETELSGHTSSAPTIPAQNANDPNTNSTSYAMRIGTRATNYYFNGYIAEAVFVDGQSLGADSFGEFDEDSPTIWKPKDVSGLTLGTNGFYLDFEDSSALGNDVAGSNNLTVSNLTAIDQSTDTCTNNFATYNALDNYFQADTLSNGNLTMTGGGQYAPRTGTIALNNGKWYWEIQVNNWESSDGTSIGISSELATASNYEFVNKSGATVGYGYFSNGVVYGNFTSQATGYSTASGTHIIGVALNLTDNKIAWSYDGTWQGSTDPSSGNTNMISITDPTSLTSGTYFPAFSQKDNSRVLNVNFGSPAFAISSGNSDANGYGNFEYAVPSGYYSLNTKNLAEFG